MMIGFTIAIIFFISLSLYAGLVLASKSKMIMGFILSGFMGIMLLMRFNVTLEDCLMLIYEWKVAMMMPVMVEYQDIKSVEAIGKHKIKIVHKVISYTYVRDAGDFMENYQMLKAAWDQKQEENACTKQVED